jgi:hypothetical protein
MTERDGKRLFGMLPRGRQASSALRHLTEHEVRAIDSALIVSRRRSIKQPCEGALRGDKVAGEKL